MTHLRVFGFRDGLRWIHRGRHLNPFFWWELQQLSDAGTVKLQCTLSILGGARQELKDAKMEEVKNELMATLSSHYLSFSSILPCIAAVTDKRNAPLIRKTLGIKDHKARWLALCELSMKAGFDLEAATRTPHRAATRIQKMVKSKQPTAKLRLDDIRIEAQSFQLKDGSFSLARSSSRRDRFRVDPYTASNQRLWHKQYTRMIGMTKIGSLLFVRQPKPCSPSLMKRFEAVFSQFGGTLTETIHPSPFSSEGRFAHETPSAIRIQCGIRLTQGRDQPHAQLALCNNLDKWIQKRH